MIQTTNLQQFFEQNLNEINRIVTYITQKPSLFKELLSSIYLNFKKYDYLNKFDPSLGTYRNYVFTHIKQEVSRFFIKDKLRKINPHKHKRMSLVYMDSYILDQCNFLTEYQDPMELIELYDKINTFYRGLTEKQQELFTDRWNGLKLKQLALEQGVTISQVWQELEEIRLKWKQLNRANEILYGKD